MATLSPASQAILTNFSHQPGVSVDQAANLQAAVQSSPALIDELNQAVARGYLRQIVPLSHANAGGEYDSTNKAMHLPLADLTTGSSTYSPGNVIFVLGHELQHGFNDATTKQATQDFYNDARQMAARPENTHDYTPIVGALIAANRRDEASAEIAGWNAIVSSVKTTNPSPTLNDIYNKAPGRMADFIVENSAVFPRTYTLKPNLTLNHDLTLSPTPHNVKGMGENYFDHTGSQARLGYRGNSDYTNYYGTYAVSVIGQLERQHHPTQPGNEPARVALDMRSLRLSETLMEENGIDLGPNTQPLPYMDRSTSPPTLHHFDHTATTHTHVPVQAPEPRPDTQATLTPARLDDPAHPGHAMYQQGLAGVLQLNATHGVATSPRDARIAGALTVEATAKGLTRIDHVLLNDDAGRVFAVQGAMSGISGIEKQWAQVDTMAAIKTPLEQSSAQYPHAVREAEQLQITQQQEMQAQQQRATTQHSVTTATGPSL